MQESLTRRWPRLDRRQALATSSGILTAPPNSEQRNTYHSIRPYPQAGLESREALISGGANPDLISNLNTDSCCSEFPAGAVLDDGFYPQVIGVYLQHPRSQQKPRT